MSDNNNPSTGSGGSYEPEYPDNDAWMRQIPDPSTLMDDPNQPARPKQAEAFTFSSADDMADNAKAPTFLINELLEQDSHGLLVGASMSFKTFAAIRLAHSICTGKSFFNHAIQEQGKVLYVCGEGKGALSRRFKAITKELGSFDGNLIVLNEQILIDAAVPMLELEKLITEQKPVLVIFDTFSSLIGGTQENSNSDVANCLRLIKGACSSSNKTSSIIVHHTGKDTTSGTRGASAFQGNVEFLFTMERAEGSMLTTLHCEKQKDWDSFDDIAMEAKAINIDLALEDGTPVNSLVMIETNKKPEKNFAKLNQTQQCFENAFAKVMRENPQEVTAELKALYRFDKSAQVANINEVKQHFYSTITVTSKGDIQAAKRSAFTRTIAHFYKNNKFVHSGELIWRFSVYGGEVEKPSVDSS